MNVKPFSHSSAQGGVVIPTNEVVAIIPARGGSKGIPRKNLLRLHGHPLVAWSIFATRASRRVSRVFVSTDDQEIANVSREYGAEVIIRPEEISHDSASSEAALLHALAYIEEQLDCFPDLLVFLQPTSPIRSEGDVDGAIEQLLSDGADSCFTACLEHFTGRWVRNAEGGYEPCNFEPGARPMRQDYPLQYLENGSIYVMKTDVLRTQRSRMGGRVTVYPANAVKSLQLDEPGDIPLIEACMSALPAWVPASVGLNRLRNVKLLVLDFDGVFTDNHVYVNSHGEESVRCSRADSLGLDYLRKAGLAVLVLSTETNAVVAQRCKKLGLECITGCPDKVLALQKEIASRAIQFNDVAYMGNDLNDLACMEQVGVAIAPCDAHPSVLNIAHLTTELPGGQGAIRQVAEWYLGLDHDAGASG